MRGQKDPHAAVNRRLAQSETRGTQRVWPRGSGSVCFSDAGDIYLTTLTRGDAQVLTEEIGCVRYGTGTLGRVWRAVPSVPKFSVGYGGLYREYRDFR